MRREEEQAFLRGSIMQEEKMIVEFIEVLQQFPKEKLINDYNERLEYLQQGRRK